MTPDALDVHARDGVVIVRMTPDAAHRIACILSETPEGWPDAAGALVSAANHADYTVPAHFAPAWGSSPLRRSPWNTSDARFSPGCGPRMTVGMDGPAWVYAPGGGV